MKTKDRFVNSFNNKKLTYFLTYTLLWFLGALLIYIIFQKLDRNFLYVNDGAYQHFPAFNYICEFFEKLFNGSGLNSMGPYNYSLGQGGDILTTLNSYDFTDPISWICAPLVFLSKTARYGLMVFIKLWLVGLSFAIYNFIIEKKDHLAILCGSLMYTFSGAIIFMFARHPNYINWAYFLPLILAGYELFKRKRKIHLLILAVFLNLLTSYYTFYMNAVLLILYMLVHNICNVVRSRSVKTIKTEIIEDLKTAGLCLIGVLLEAITFIPLVYAFMNNARTGGLTGYTSSAIHFEKVYYERLITAIFMPYTNGSYTSYIGIFPLAILGIVVLFFKKKKNTELKLIMILMAIFACIPLFGRVMNGFGYATNRWFYAIVFFVSIVFVEVFDDICKMSGNKKGKAIGISIFYVFVVAVGERHIFAGFIKYITMTAILIVVVVFGIMAGKRAKALRTAMLIMTLVLLVLSNVLTFIPEAGDYSSSFMKSSTWESYYSDSSLLAYSELSEDNFYRVESLETNYNRSSLVNGYGTDVWYSVLPTYLSEYLYDFELNTINQNCRFEGLDSRSSLFEIASVKYYTSPASKKSLIPMGYEYSETLSNEKFNVYENKFALPIAYSIEKYITKDEYEELSPLEKQRALMQAAVIDEAVDGMEHAEINTELINIEYAYESCDRVEVSDNLFVSDGDDGTVTYSADVPANAEIYFVINGVTIDSPNNMAIYVSRNNEDKSYNIEKKGVVSNIHFNWQVTHESLTYNLGISGEGKNTFTIRFRHGSKVHYDSIEIIAIPMDTYEEEAKALKEYSMENAHVDGSHISGDITLPNTRVVQISVPYSKGWKAYVDGVETEIISSDVMYMGIVVDEGTHHIELKYTIPYLKIGAIVSLIALLAWIAVAFISRKRNKKLNDIM